MSANTKITALYERLSQGDEQRNGGDSNSIKNQKAQLETYARQQGFTNIKHYTDDDERRKKPTKTASTTHLQGLCIVLIAAARCIFSDQRKTAKDHTPNVDITEGRGIE